MTRNLLRILFILLCSVQFATFAQDTSRLRISLLTCTPGDELYSLFGHSAIRVTDSNSVTDYVYNYGTFNFDDEGFYLKFVRGKLLYYISVEEFEHFKYLYQVTNRGITEQVLDLTGEEKISLRKALNENLKEENKYYQYDFFLDNCTTRLRDLIIKIKKPAPDLPAVMPENTRFREAIHQYLDSGKQYWSKLGIDILLGEPTDIIMTPSQQQFLPDNLMMAIEGTKNTNLVESTRNLYPIDESANMGGRFTPMVFFLSLLALYVLLSISRKQFIQSILAGLDGMLFFLTGLLGFLLIFMWTGTDHSMARNNFNLLWAIPTHVMIAFFISSGKKWVKIYFLVTAVIMGLLIISWFFLPQQMNNALLPMVLLIAYRSTMRWLS